MDTTIIYDSQSRWPRRFRANQNCRQQLVVVTRRDFQCINSSTHQQSNTNHRSVKLTTNDTILMHGSHESSTTAHCRIHLRFKISFRSPVNRTESRGSVNISVTICQSLKCNLMPVKVIISFTTRHEAVKGIMQTDDR
jgi:hypothetical protein